MTFEYEVHSPDGSIRTVVRFSSNEKSIEITQTYIQSRRNTNTIKLTDTSLTHEDAAALCSGIMQAFAYLYPEEEEKDEESLSGI